MATEFEELKITISLTDQASGQMGQLLNRMGELGQGQGQAAVRGFKELATHAKVTGEHAKSLTTLFTELGALLPPQIKAMIAIGGYVGSITGGLIAKAHELKQWSDSIVQMANAARQIGISYGEFRGAAEHMEQFGISTSQAASTMQGVSNAISDMLRPASRLRQDLLGNAKINFDAMADFIDQLTKATSTTERLNLIREAGENVFQNALRETGSEIEARNRQLQFYQKLGADPSLVNVSKKFEVVSEEQQRRWNDMAAHATVYTAQMTRISSDWVQIGEVFKDEWLRPGSPFMVMVEMAEVATRAILNTVLAIDKIISRWVTVPGWMKDLGNQPTDVMPGEYPMEPLPKILPEEIEKSFRSPERLGEPPPYTVPGGPTFSGKAQFFAGSGGDEGENHAKLIADNTELLKQLNDRFDVLLGKGRPVVAQAFAKGGRVTQPTTALVGEAGEPEVIVGGGKRTVVSKPTLTTLGKDYPEAVMPLRDYAALHKKLSISGDTMKVGESRTGRASFYGNFQGQYPWIDKGDMDKQGRPLPGYSGTPLNVPGIALPSAITAGRPDKQEGAWFAVKGPDGKTYYAQQVDVGPGKRTGREIDINAALAERMGYVPDEVKGGKHFPTDAQFTWDRVDPEEAVWMGHPFDSDGGGGGGGSGGETQVADNRSVIDRSMGQQQNPNLQADTSLSVNFKNAPVGMRTEASGTGALKDNISVSRETTLKQNESAGM